MSEVGIRPLLESPIVGGTTPNGSARVIEMVGLPRVVVVVFKTDGWVEVHIEPGRPGGLLGREREPTDLKALSSAVGG